jgi:adhesin transport system membrane fusion protein
MSPLDALIARHPLPTWRVVAWPVMALLSGLAVWSIFAELDEVAVAAGEVVPQGRVKVIQHLEGGIVEKIHVQEGSVVAAGTPLVQLNLATAGVNRNELQARLDGDLLRRARLGAEITGGTLSLPEEIAGRRPDMAAAERDGFAARRSERASTLGVFDDQIRQRALEVQELEARRTAVANGLALARQRLEMSHALLKDGLTPQMEHLQLQAEVEKLAGELKGLTQAVPRARAAQTESLKRRQEAEIRFRREAQEQLEATEQSLARLRELLAEATDQDVRAEIRSPIEGIVKRLRYHTIGGVVSPREPIMEIVPLGDDLVVRARLNPIDRGYVNAGQPALVKISTYDFVQYGGLTGRVAAVAPDSTTDGSGQTFFEVVVETEKTALEADGAIMPISPGMQAVVDIHTGRKSVWQYLIKPVLKLRHEAFRER